MVESLNGEPLRAEHPNGGRPNSRAPWPRLARPRSWRPVQIALRSWPECHEKFPRGTVLIHSGIPDSCAAERDCLSIGCLGNSPGRDLFDGASRAARTCFLALSQYSMYWPVGRPARCQRSNATWEISISSWLVGSPLGVGFFISLAFSCASVGFIYGSRFTSCEGRPSFTRFEPPVACRRTVSGVLFGFGGPHPPALQNKFR